MFSKDESLALARLKVQYASEKHESEANTQKHLDFLRWLYQHGKMELDTLPEESIAHDWRRLQQSDLAT